MQSNASHVWTREDRGSRLCCGAQICDEHAPRGHGDDTHHDLKNEHAEGEAIDNNQPVQILVVVVTLERSQPKAGCIQHDEGSDDRGNGEAGERRAGVVQGLVDQVALREGALRSPLAIEIRCAALLTIDAGVADEAVHGQLAEARVGVLPPDLGLGELGALHPRGARLPRGARVLLFRVDLIISGCRRMPAAHAVVRGDTCGFARS
eukprot:2663967-Prymnesium_polylepis.2